MLTAATPSTGTRRVRRRQRRHLRQERAASVAAHCVEGLQAHGVGCARPFRLNRRRLGGDSQRVRRCRRHRRGSRRRHLRQERAASVAAVRSPVSASKVYGANVGGCVSISARTSAATGQQLPRQTMPTPSARLTAVACAVSSIYGANVGGLAAIVGASDDADAIGAAHGGDSGDTFDRNAPRPAATAATMPTGSRRNRRGLLVACLCIDADRNAAQPSRLCGCLCRVEGLQAHGVGCACPLRRECRRLGGDSWRVRRCRRHRRGSRRR